MADTSDEFPTEIGDKMQMFHESVEKIGTIINPFLDKKLDDDEKLSPLDKARLYLTAVYTMNSLFWMNLVVKGENPKEHPIKEEIDRVKMYLMRMKEIEDKSKAPKLNVSAAKMFIRSGLWEPSSQESETKTSGESEQPVFKSERDHDSLSAKRKTDSRQKSNKRKCI